MDWQTLAVVSPFFFVAFQTLSKFLPKTLSIFLVNGYASLMGALIMFLIHFLMSSNKSIALPSKYLPIAIGIGILISIGNFAVIKAYSLGAPQSAFTAIFNPLYIVYGLIFGFLIWHENLTWPQIFGAFLSMVGILIMVYFKK